MPRDVTAFEPPLKAAPLKKMPPVPAVLAMTDPLEVAVTSIFPVIVAEPIIENAVVVAAFEPAEAADHATVGRVATIEEVISVTIGVAYVLDVVAVPAVTKLIYHADASAGDRPR